MLKFRDVDFINFASLLSEEERLARDNARQWTEDRVIPIIEACARDGRFPQELVPEMGRLGFFGASLQGYGCAGLSNVEYGLVMQELERGDSGVRSFVSVQSALVMYPIHAFGSEEQKTYWLPKLQSGEKLGCFGLTEPDFGSNPGGMRSRARRSGKEYVLNGEKMWITSGSISDVAVVWAKDDDGVVAGFLVETNLPGFRTEDVHGKMSLRASVTSSLSLHDVRIPLENRLPGATGLKYALMCLNQARYGIGWGVIGSAMQCYDTALQYTLFRKQFGDKPLAGHQIVQERLVEMITEISKAQLLALQVGRLKDQGRATHPQISMLKRNNCGIALDVARRARDLLGANGIADEYPVFRHMANLESVNTYEGTHDIHTLAIGESITGIAAYD
jgi:glutaryl-CoA dehydrogenase